MRGHRGRRIWEMPKKIKQSQLVGREGGGTVGRRRNGCAEENKATWFGGAGCWKEGGSIFKGNIEIPEEKDAVSGGQKIF